MDGSFMTAVEQQHYSELFSKSDVDNTGKVSTLHVRNLFLSSQLPMETLQQIVELCGAARVGHFKRSQFYFALKLIAMAQNGLPLPSSIDKINTGVEVPLPAFASNAGPDVSDPNSQMEFINPAFIDHAPEQDVEYDYPPIKQEPPAEWTGGGGGGFKNTLSSPPCSPKHTSSPSFQNCTPPTSPPHTSRSLERHKSLPSSPREITIKEMNRHSSIDVQVGTPVRVPPKEGEWASFEEEKEEQNNHSQTPQLKSQPQGEDGDTSWARFPADQSGDDDHPDLAHSVSIPGSEGSISEEDVWQISAEQRTYYTNQFQRLQPEQCGLLGGAEAKGFFEKSKLPTSVLSIIWQLSDVNKDGTLSLEEFCTAMHLVVLRKHNIPLPEKLPPCLVPQVGAPPAEEKEAHTFKSVPDPDGKVIEPTNVPPTLRRSVTPPVENNKTAKTKDENWAKFNDSPLPRPPSPSSQSPANFDFASISPDPEAKIFQPIPLHVSPSGNRSVVIDTEQRGRTHSDPIRQDSSSDHEYDVPPPTLPEKKKRANTLTSDSSTPAKIAPPPPNEKSSRRGDSLERGLAASLVGGTETAALPRPRSRSCSGMVAQQTPPRLSKFPMGTPVQTALVESTAETGEGDTEPIPQKFESPGDIPTPQLEIRLRAASLDSTTHRIPLRMPLRSSSSDDWTLNESVLETSQNESELNSGSNIGNINGSDEFVEESISQNPISIILNEQMSNNGGESTPPLDSPPPLPSPPPLIAPLPPARWRSASLDNCVVRSQIRPPTTAFKQVSPSESMKETTQISKEDLTETQSAVESQAISNIERDSSPEPLFPSIAPPPRLADIKTRSASLDYKLFCSERNSDMGHHLRPSIPPRTGAQKTYPSQTSKSSSVQSSAASSSSASDSSSHSSSAEDDDDDDNEDNRTADFADFSKFESMTADSPIQKNKKNRVATAQYTPVDSTPRLSPPPPPPPPRQQALEDACTDSHYDKSLFLASKERHKSGDELQADRKREQFAHERHRHASAPDPVTSTQVPDYDRKSIQAAIRRAKEENTKLSRLNSELQQELKQMMEDRIRLETQLERLRPFSSTS